MIAINGMPDHTHLFVGLHPTQSISRLIQIVKGESSEWINVKRFAKGKFQWQEFSVFNVEAARLNFSIFQPCRLFSSHRQKDYLPGSGPFRVGNGISKCTAIPGPVRDPMSLEKLES